MESTKQKHKRWRKQFNEDCLKRDKNKCVFCDMKENLDVHHIIDRHDLPNGGYVISNGITVCEEHHLLCEQWHDLGLGDYKYHSSRLFEKINSSYEQALKDSENLK